jgi:hypothetical protein
LTSTNCQQTSNIDQTYNCLAFAALDLLHVWDPSLDQGYYWPPGIPAGTSAGDWMKALKSRGFVWFHSGDMQPEPHLVKVVIFGSVGGQATHAARQLKNGQWTSKLGDYEDIVHDKPEDVAGGSYGQIWLVVARERSPDDP